MSVSKKLALAANRASRSMLRPTLLIGSVIYKLKADKTRVRSSSVAKVNGTHIAPNRRSVLCASRFFFAGETRSTNQQLQTVCAIKSSSYRHDRIIAYCLRDEMEKTFRLDRMHLPEPPLPDGRNDFRAIARCLNGAQMPDGMRLILFRGDF